MNCICRTLLRKPRILEPEESPAEGSLSLDRSKAEHADGTVCVTAIARAIIRLSAIFDEQKIVLLSDPTNLIQRHSTSEQVRHKDRPGPARDRLTHGFTVDRECSHLNVHGHRDQTMDVRGYPKCAGW